MTDSNIDHSKKSPTHVAYDVRDGTGKGRARSG